MDAPTIGVLRDLAILVWMAILAGAVAYKVIGLIGRGESWSLHGRIITRHYLPIDAILVAAISMILLAGLQMQNSIAQTELPEPLPQMTALPLAINIAFLLLVCAALLFYLRSVRGLDPVELFGLRRVGFFKAIGLALLFIVPTLAVVNGTAYGVAEWMRTFWPELNPQDAVKAFQESGDPLIRLLLIVAAVIVAPLVEETIFRGFIYGVVKRYTDGYFAALCSALLFALVHFHVGSLFPLTVLALLLCLAYEITGTLVVPMAMHALFNTTSILAMLLGSNQ